MKQKFRRTLSIVLCIALIFVSCPEVFAVGLEALSQIDIELNPKASETKSDAKVQKVIELIDAIGEVEYTDESLAKIVAAEKAYDKLNAEQKLQVTNYGKLKAARNAYDVMVKADIDTSNLEVLDNGTRNTTVKWAVYTNGWLEIFGEGVVPSYTSGKTPWYDYRTSVTKIIVRNSITNIGRNAFEDFTKVTDLTLPFVGESRTATGRNASLSYIFNYTGYTNNSYPAGSFTSTTAYKIGTIYSDDGSCVKYITNCVYSSSTGKYTVSYSNGYYNGSGYSYNLYNYGIKTVTITDASAIQDAAFYGCSNITEINLNDGISYIGEKAFYNTAWYNNLTEDEFVVAGDNVLIKYNGTKSSVVIPETVKSISGGVFQNNTKISEVTLHNELKGIGNRTFSGCTNLSTLTIPKSVVSVGTYSIPDNCIIYVYKPSAGYDYRSTNRVILNDSYTTGNDTFYYVVKDNGNIEIIGCETTSTEITVPTDINGVVVDEIGDYGFEKCTTINSITIPNNILNIGDYAFWGCTGLINATIPTTVNRVGDYAFKDCTGLVNVTISEGVENLGKGVFYNCTSLCEAVVPDTAETIGSYAFYNCTSMTTATIGTSAVAIEDYTFYNCKKLNAVVIGISVNKIGDYAFYNCDLSRATLPATVKTIGKYAFAENTNLTKTTLRKGTETINDYAFLNCSSMESINFPSSILNIGNHAFENCSSLASLSLPTALNTLGAYAFNNCSSVPSVTIPANITVINDGVFNDCSSLASVTINSNATSIGYKAFNNCAFAEITLPSTVETIKEAAFRQCKNLISIYLPDVTTTIGDSAFFECTALNSASIPDSVTSVGERAFKSNNDLTVAIRYVSGTIAPSILEKQGVCYIIIDETIHTIGDKAFAFCYDLATITYGDNTVNAGEFLLSPNVTTLGKQVFMDATKLKNLKVSDNLLSVGTDLFYNPVISNFNCKDVTVTFYFANGNITANILEGQHQSHIVVEDNIKTLGDKAFYNCPVLETISLPDTITTCGSNVFASSNGNVTAYFRGVDGTIDASVYDGKTKGLTYLVFDENVNTIGENAFANTDTVKGIIINDTDLISDYAFANSTSLDGIVIVKTGIIDSYAFNNCSTLEYIEIGTADTIGTYAFADSTTKRMELDNIGTIDDYAFTNCTLLENVYIDSVININDYAFFNCIAINNIKIEEDLVHIGEHAFEECKLIPALVLPDTTREIGAYAFYNCNSLKSINIPEGVTTINNHTFYGCASLLQMLLPNTVKTIGDYAFYGCVLINKLDLGDSIETIGEYAFFNCNQVKAIELPETVTTIEDYAFRSCGISEIFIPDSVVNLGNFVFYACTSLETVEYGTGVTAIGDGVFYGCVALDKVLFNGNITDIHDMAFYGAETATLYAFENEYIETYCNDYGLEYHNMNLDFTMVLTAPTKLEYVEFEELDLTGLSLALTYTTGLERTVKTGYTISGYDPTVLGKQTVTVEYNGQIETFEVNVTAKTVGSLMTIAGVPTEIIVGEELKYDNMVIKATFVDGTSVDLTEGYTVTGYDADTIGEQIITVTYREASCTFTINVKDYVRGDINGDGLVTMKDVTRLVNYLNDNKTEVIDKSLDVNGDGFVTIKDVTRLVEYLENNTVEIN